MWRRLSTFIAGPFILLAWFFAAIFSRRGMVLATFVLAGILAWGPWLRPPLARDYRGTQLTWGLSASSALDAFESREIPRHQPFGGIGSVILLFVSAAAATSLVWPRTAAWWFAGLFVLSTAALSACLLNQPALIEYLDVEAVQRAQIRTMFSAQHEDLLTGQSPDRTTDLRVTVSEHPVVGMDRGQWAAGWRYQMAGPWLWMLSALAMVATIPGPGVRRPLLTAAVVLVGIAVSAGVCQRRLRAESHWLQAESYEQRDQIEQAESSLQSAVAAMPELRDTRRYWLTAGRLAFRREHHNHHALMFQAHQLMEQKQMDAARGLLQPLADELRDSHVVADLMADLISRKALTAVLGENPGAAQAMWIEAAAYAPWRDLNWIGEGVAMASAAPHQADAVEGKLLPQIQQIGDRLVSSDIISLVGDTYFRDGQFVKAREMYGRSMSVFSLPKYVNLHAQEGILGM